MAANPWVLEDDMSCPVCFQTFSDPVVLECSHSFCRRCLDTYWTGRVIKLCPVCRQTSLTRSPTSNLVLRNIVETCAKEKIKTEEERKEWREKGRSMSTVEGERDGNGERGERRVSLNEEGEARCAKHGEKLLLFCMADNEPLCVVCQTSRKHRQHQLCPVDEAAQDLKDEFRASLPPLKKKLETFQKVKKECEKTVQHIKNQGSQTEKKIKQDFEDLHHFLLMEEVCSLSALAEDVDIKSVIMKEKIEHLSKKVASLSSTIKEIEQKIDSRDLLFLQDYKTTKERSKYPQPDPEPVLGSLVDVAKHLGNLKFSVWEKMQQKVQYFPVTLDPNTAAPWVSLSDDLTSACHCDVTSLPDNPERFDQCVCVLGAEPFSSGRHCWEVNVGSKTRWDLGVLNESVYRKGILTVNPAHAFWALALRDGGQYSACTMPWTRLTLKSKPSRVKVCLDYDKGEVSFYDSADMSLMYTFEGKFTERLLPYFSPCVSDAGRNAEPLKICPAKVSVVIDIGEDDQNKE
ncbi:zinc-binding protein A33-like [Osmerus eperlanus]|uniref:zinc-binding protein A33-like n=1 Tax=Osmerus eperlanus TaxID=29151 RepID=UPI002E108B83